MPPLPSNGPFRALRTEPPARDPGGRLAGPGQGEVLVRIAAAGLCHSDLSVIDGNRPRPLPMVLGHEAAGVVEALGDGVDDSRWAITSSSSSSQLRQLRMLRCRTSGPLYSRRGGERRGSSPLGPAAAHTQHPDHALNHHLGVSAFAEYVPVSRRSLVVVDRDLPFEHAALFGCAVLTGVGE